MQVLGNARALAFQGALLLQVFQLALVLSLFKHPRRAGNGRQQTERRETEKPSRLPKMAQHRQFEIRAGFVPDAFAVTGGHAETILAGRDVTVEGRAACFCVHPFGIKAFEPVTKADPFRSSETEAGVMELQAMFPGGDSDGVCGT